MDPRIVELLERLGEVSDDQLADLEDIIVAGLEEAAEAKDVDTARSYAEAIERVRNERSERLAQAQAREAEIASIMQRVHTASDESGEDDGADGADEEDGDEGGSDDAPASSGGGEEDATSTASTRPLPKISDLTRKRATSGIQVGASKRTKPSEGALTVVAAVDVPGLAAGSEIPDPATLRSAMVERWQGLSASRGLSGNFPVAKFRNQYPDERTLHAGDEEGNWEKIQKVVSPAALVASGGICAPVAGFYDANTLAGAARPLRDALPRFGADRGGIRFIRASTISDQTGAIGHITEAEDASSTSKPCLAIVCEDVQEVLVNAISRCLQFGNFNARTHPEYVTHITDLTLAAHARVAEQNLWQQMRTDSTAVTAGENLSAFRDVYAVLARAAAQYRSRHRMTIDRTLRWVAPFWVGELLSADLVRQAPGDNTIAGVSRAQFESALAKIGISVTWTYEGGTTVTGIYGTQAAGGLLPWNSTVETLLYAEGTFLYLDHGTLDLGVVRDSTLNLTNDFQTFAEVFENVAFLGPESLRLTMDICPSGISAGQDDSFDPCTLGS